MASAVGTGGLPAGSPSAESAQQKKATSKHKAMERQLVEDPSREAISLDKLLDHERLDLKWLKRDLAVNTLPETMAVLREIENRSETPLLREDGRPRRRKRVVRRSRHARFDRPLRSSAASSADIHVMPQHSYTSSLSWDDRQSFLRSQPGEQPAGRPSLRTSDRGELTEGHWALGDDASLKAAAADDTAETRAAGAGPSFAEAREWGEVESELELAELGQQLVEQAVRTPGCFLPVCAVHLTYGAPMGFPPRNA